MGSRSYVIDLDSGYYYYDHYGAYDIWEAAKNGDDERIREIAINITMKDENPEPCSVDLAKELMLQWDIEAGILIADGKYYVWLSSAPYTARNTPIFAITEASDKEAIRYLHLVAHRTIWGLSLINYIDNPREAEVIERATTTMAEQLAQEWNRNTIRTGKPQIRIGGGYTTIHPLDFITNKVITFP